MKMQFEQQYKILGHNIKCLRQANHYTQEQLAKMIGITSVHLGRIENGKVGLSLDILFAIVEVFKIQTGELLKPFE